MYSIYLANIHNLLHPVREGIVLLHLGTVVRLDELDSVVGRGAFDLERAYQHQLQWKSRTELTTIRQQTISMAISG
jgi:hypothetical protein